MEGTTLRNPNVLRTILIDAGYDPDELRDFLQEHIQMDRETDKLCQNELGKCEFYKRELKYSRVERFMLNLK